jgi:hypothetical protein
MRQGNDLQAGRWELTDLALAHAGGEIPGMIADKDSKLATASR